MRFKKLKNKAIIVFIYYLWLVTYFKQLKTSNNIKKLFYYLPTATTSTSKKTAFLILVSTNS